MIRSLAAIPLCSIAAGELIRYAQFASIKIGVGDLCGWKVFLEANSGDY
jgi:hypothetical protein